MGDLNWSANRRVDRVRLRRLGCCLGSRGSRNETDLQFSAWNGLIPLARVPVVGPLAPESATCENRVRRNDDGKLGHP